MKYRLICLFTVITIFAVTVSILQIDTPKKRYHQHLEKSGYNACTYHGEEVFCTHLPLMNIVTEDLMPDPYLYDENGEYLRNEKDRRVVNKTMVSALVNVFDSDTGNNHLTDTPSITSNAAIRIRGNSSRSFDKNNYLLKFVTEDRLDSLDISLAGMATDNNWVLHGPVLDKTLIRNYVCYNLAGSVMDYVPNVRFCELFLNNEYLGVYLITEKIEYSENSRVNITKTDPDIPETSYILKLDKGDVDELHLLHTFSDYTGKNGKSNRPNQWLEVVYPSTTLTEEQKQNIEYEISHLEKALASFDSGDNILGYPAYLDVDSFVEFFVLNEFMMNFDAGRLSTYYAKDIRGKITIIAWDYNNTFNNYFVDLTVPQDIYSSNTWYKYLLRDKDFTNKVIKTYREFRNTILSEGYIYDYIDDVVEYLGPAVERNYKRWEHTFTYDYMKENQGVFLEPLERNPTSYEEAIEQMKMAISIRGEWLDNNIESLLARSHYSANKRFRRQEDD